MYSAYKADFKYTIVYLLYCQSYKYILLASDISMRNEATKRFQVK